MSAYDSATYGDRIATVYDRLVGVSAGDTIAAVDCLTTLAGHGPALELGIGTGRIALPLAARGLHVQGIDASAKMVDELRKKPGGGDIPVVLGDFSATCLEKRFSLIYVVFNTFFALLSQEAQTSCFQNMARMLLPGGAFVIEAFVPDLTRFSGGNHLSTSTVDTDYVQLDASSHDPVTQRVNSQSIFLSDEGIRLYPVNIRYAWPSELDLMGRLAGLCLRDRWGTWRKDPFTAASGKHISVYELA